MPEIIFPYSDVELTEEVNRIPNQFGYLNALNWFPNEGKASIYVRIEFRDGEIYVLGAEPRGAGGDASANDTENGIIVQIPHFPHLDLISTADVDGVLEVINGAVTPASLDRELARKLRNIRWKHSITREFVRLGALKGLIKDGKGRTLYDLYQVFNITKKTVDFALGTDATDVIAKCEEVTDHIHTNLKGEVMTGIEVPVDTLFFNKFIKHPSVEKYWLQTLNSAVSSQVSMTRQNLGGNWGRTFDFGQGGILLREYKGSLPMKDANGNISSQKNMADNSGIAVPVGTMNTMRTFDGPVFHMAMVNQVPPADNGEPIYISSKVLDHGAGVELKSQSNVLAINKRPELAVEVITSN